VNVNPFEFVGGKEQLPAPCEGDEIVQSTLDLGLVTLTEPSVMLKFPTVAVTEIPLGPAEGERESDGGG
jgi:hypothetical protein